MLEIVNSLLKHLKQSVMSDIPESKGADALADEKLFQESLISALAEFAYHLPDYQKIEIMMFIIGRTPGTGSEKCTNPAEVLLQHMLLKCLLKVSYKYRTTNYSTTLPLTFLDPLLRTSLGRDADVRLLVQKILHCLIDRHDNRDKLKKPRVDIGELGLTIEKCSRTDCMFYKNHGNRILTNLSESFELDSVTRDNIDATFCTAALICVELASDDTLVDILRWALAVQDVAVTNSALPLNQRSAIHVVAISIVVLAGHVMNVPQLLDYSARVVAARTSAVPHLVSGASAKAQQLEDIPAECLLEYSAIAECMKEAGKDIMGMIPLQVRNQQFHLRKLDFYFELFVQQGAYNSNQRYSWADSTINQSSSGDLANIQLEIESNSSSPGLPRKPIEEEVTFEALKKILAEPAETRREAELEKRQMICEKFRNTPFQQLVASSQSKVTNRN